MNFENPWLVLLLLLVFPGLLLWYRSVRRQRQRLERFTEYAFAGFLFAGLDPVYRRLHFILFFTGLLFILLSMNGPQIGGGREKVKLTGIDIVVALDISNSMRAQDIQPSRIDRARLALMQLISNLGTDRLGLVVFAGQSYTALPLADDPAAAEMVVESVDTEMITMQGTAIGAAIEQGIASFDTEEKNRGKAIILISDGENHEDDALEATKKAVEKGIIVCAIGVGSVTGTPIPEFDAKGNFSGNKLDEHGAEIKTRLNEQLLREIARQGKGVYQQANSADLGIGSVYASLQGLNKTTKETWRYTSFDTLAPWLIGCAILLLIIEPVIPQGKRKEK
ncbi:MAG TPA: VWA domain-containing protein [Bacteroidia bacterium]|nr:VWA domain-containing protein [Bacteroidia bacterium]